MSDVLQRYNRNEFHHIYPRAFLAGERNSTSDNVLANIAFITSAENKKLGGRAPSKYRSDMATASLQEIVARALCPMTMFDDNYEAFVAERSRILANSARDLMELPEA
jgi:hypothetical protein